MAGRLRRQHGRSAPISNSKNPLARALGLALQRARREEPGRPSSEELASAIGLSASLYRLVESGGAILQPAYALRTTLAFPNAKLEFLPLVCLLGVIQILESRDHPDNRRLLAEQMRQAEPRLAFVLDSLGGLDSSAMSTPESLSRCMHAVLAFLQTPLSSPEPPVDVARAWGERLARSSYPLHLEILDQISAELGSFSPGMSVNQLGQWEKRHAHRIGTAFALMTSVGVLNKSLEEFGYWSSFLQGRNLKSVHFLLLSPSAHLEAMRAAFLGFVDRLRHQEKGAASRRKPVPVEVHFPSPSSQPATVGRPESRDPALIHFEYCLTPKDAEIGTLAGKALGPFRTAWLYHLLPPDGQGSTEPSCQLAFKDSRSDDRQAEPVQAVHCSWQETEQLSRIFLAVWPFALPASS
jgi:transcriptional regulator with XRE-family HTH domain